MAVQAQRPSNPFRGSNGVFEDASANLLRACDYAFHPQILNGTVFSDPESELTCDAAGPRKRNYLTPQEQKQILQHQLRFSSFQKIHDKIASLPPISNGGLDLCQEEHRLIESAATSTSGRSAFNQSPLLAQDIVSSFHQQSVEVEDLIRIQTVNLRLGLEESRKRNITSLLPALEYRALKRLKEKETELESIRRKNAELEERVKQMSAENQIWCHVARNNEAIVSNLRTSLEQILLQNSSGAKEGYGDSSDVADDAQSSCYDAAENRSEKTARENREMKVRRTCKACRVNEVSVLLLPCRHLCLCKECESRQSSCPICQSTKNASLQIFMS